MGRLVNSFGLRLGQEFAEWRSSDMGFNLKRDQFCSFVELLCSKGVKSYKRQFSSWFLVESVNLRKTSAGFVVVIRLYDSGLDSTVSKYVTESKLLLLEYYIVKELRRVFGANGVVKFVFLKGGDITSELLAKYIQHRLEQRASLPSVIASVRQVLMSTRGILGFRLDFSGRFTRRQRASFGSVSQGNVPFSTLGADISIC